MHDHSATRWATPETGDPAWARALNLGERKALGLGNPADLSAEDLARARRRALRWKTEGPFEQEGLWAQRLEQAGLTEEEWLGILGRSADTPAPDGEAPPWVRDLLASFTGPRGDKGPVAASGTRAREHAALGFLVALEPLLRHFRDRLEAALVGVLESHPEAPFDCATATRLLTLGLTPLLLPKIDRTLVLEMHVARMTGRLPQATGEERYQSFLASLTDRAVALDLLREYPVLARQLVAHLTNWLDASVELLLRLAADWRLIRRHLGPAGEPGRLVALELGAGDRHRGGRAVALLVFESGFRLVYKPKPLAVDRHFQDLLTWLNGLHVVPPHRPLRILDRGRYGWLEFVAAAPCKDREELERFYLRQGSLMALLLVLRATDFHFENVIAAGEHPVLVDLETLFHPQLSAARSEAERLGEELIHGSVLWSGMLPQRVFRDASSPGIEISGLGARKGQATPFGAPDWAEAGTDGMRWTRRTWELEVGENRPTLDGHDVDAWDYAEAIVAGFTATYRAVLAHRDALVAPGGPVAAFADDEVRVVLRPSQRYSVLIHDSFHPDFLRDGLDRERFLDRLWAEVHVIPALARAIRAERADLDQGDIPVFTTCPASRDLVTSRGEILAGLSDASGLDLVRRGLESMGEADLERQVWLIRAALATLEPAVDGRRASLTIQNRVDPTVRRGQSGPPSPDELIERAQVLGDRLERLAVRGRNEALWVGLTLGGRGADLAPLDGGLYNGIPGVVLFLAHLADVTGQARYADLARAAFVPWIRQVDQGRRAFETIGGFDGWGSAVYALTHLGALWGDTDLLARARDAVDHVEALVAADSHLDVIGGAAGAIAPLLGLHGHFPKALEVAVACGDHLLAKAQPAGPGLAWPSAVDVVAPLTGFAHGAGGSAWALLKLWAASNDARFRTAGLAALAYERSVFAPDAGNWPDWRKDGTEAPATPFFGLGWCHGAPGIGLSRLDVLPHLDEAARAEVEVALSTTRRQGFGDNHSLCHGDLGNLELLLHASRSLPEGAWADERRTVLAGILADLADRGPVCGTPRQVESPGFMAGLAGIGYGLLRQALPERIPSILLLAPPAGAGRTLAGLAQHAVAQSR